ncbi:uncharacterized protein M437DRAFT_89434 [Aureobasidium melanogenum CBS 110374]|uniref:Uncharacterized protein n=1 Tax=Aureobasidium melanogenum (strain CBS 110374) TaxID=1043003 RepID=A0A074VIL8_AURM1|nr:uncharacterized protein M437DRAFT_89434 [Aureobasidium melanogenum CBS 110374]KEQ57457.1 hypothetical protein M437DRAFT_89434 [Aureobasidium melanogenum CBS 110374]
MSASITRPTTSSLTRTSKRSSNSGGKPPYKPLGKGGPKGHYAIKKDLDDARKKSRKLDLYFAI